MDRATLLRIADACRQGEAIAVEDGMALSKAIISWDSGASRSLDQAFGVRRRRGQRSNQFEALMAARDLMLRQCAAQFYCGSANAAAEMARDASRYEAAGWPRDRSSKLLPQAYVGSARAFWFQILCSGAVLPTTERRIRAILQMNDAEIKYPHFISTASD